MTRDTFWTIEGLGEGEYRNKGSRFIAYARHVTSKQQVKAWYSSLRNEHLKAVHICYGCRLGPFYDSHMANDDGEPSGSAGLPILGQIDSFNLTNTAVMVVRYFGGVLLGIPGLIKAYKTATREALSVSTVVKQKICKRVQLDCEYKDMRQLLYRIKQLGGQVINQATELRCKLVVDIPIEEYERFLACLSHTVVIGEQK
ncbi:MAG: YigZ family protein [Neisseriaceae bacterium]